MHNRVTSLYIHFPFCRHLCNFCDFYKEKTNNLDEQIEYLQRYLVESWDELWRFMQLKGQTWGTLKTIYIGGGTPSLWGEKGILFLKNFLALKNISLASDCEWTLEINPDKNLTQDLVKWKELGINRFSLGVQTLDEKVLKTLDRNHSLEDSFEMLNALSEMQVNFSVDFMIGTPFSRELNRDIAWELQTLFANASPKHISLYIMSTRKHYKHFRQLPDDDWVANEYLLIHDFLRDKGMEHYEVSNYAYPTFQSQHNLSYWGLRPVAALGRSATGLLWSDSQKAFRYKWKTKSPHFTVEELNSSQIKLERLYLELRTLYGHDPTDNLTPDEANIFYLLAQNWQQRNLTRQVYPAVCLNARGFLVLDSLMDELFRKIPSI